MLSLQSLGAGDRRRGGKIPLALTRYVIWFYKDEEAETSSTRAIRQEPCGGWSSETTNTLVEIKLIVSPTNSVL